MWFKRPAAGYAGGWSRYDLGANWASGGGSALRCGPGSVIANPPLRSRLRHSTNAVHREPVLSDSGRRHLRGFAVE